MRAVDMPRLFNASVLGRDMARLPAHEVQFRNNHSSFTTIRRPDLPHIGC